MNDPEAFFFFDCFRPISCPFRSPVFEGLSQNVNNQDNMYSEAGLETRCMCHVKKDFRGLFLTGPFVTTVTKACHNCANTLSQL